VFCHYLASISSISSVMQFAIWCLWLIWINIFAPVINVETQHGIVLSWGPCWLSLSGQQLACLPACIANRASCNIVQAHRVCKWSICVSWACIDRGPLWWMLALGLYGNSYQHLSNGSAWCLGYNFQFYQSAWEGMIGMMSSCILFHFIGLLMMMLWASSIWC